MDQKRKNYFSWDLPEEAEAFAGAVVLLLPHLRTTVFENLSVDTWCAIHRAAPNPSKLRKRALDKVRASTDETFDSWHCVWQEAHDEDADLEQEAVRKLMDLSTQKDQFFWLIHQMKDPAKQEELLEKMSNSPEVDVKGWYEVFSRCDSPSVTNYGIKKYATMVSTTWDWLTVYVCADDTDDPSLRMKAIHKAIEASDGPRNIASDNGVAIFDYIAKDQELEDAAFLKLLDLAKTYEQLLKCFDIAQTNRARRKLVFERLVSFRSSGKKVFPSTAIYSLVWNDRALRSVLRAKMIEELAQIGHGDGCCVSESSMPSALEEAGGSFEKAVDAQFAYWKKHPRSFQGWVRHAN
jgi:hypothetical protein